MGFSVGHVFSVCSPTAPRSLGRSSPNFRILARGIHLLKVKVMEVKSQISISQQFWSDLHKTWCVYTG